MTKLMRERAVDRWREDVHSALYYLVWHRGMTIDAANGLLDNCRSTIPTFARRGRIGFAKCCKALSKWIDSLQPKRRASDAALTRKRK